MITANIKLPNHPQYRDGMFLWTSKVMTVPEYWSHGRKEKEVLRRGKERILRGVTAHYGEERELRNVDIVALGKLNGDSAFVLLAYVPCNAEERPEGKLILPN